MAWQPDYETASGGLPPLEYSNGGYITALDGKTIAAPPHDFDPEPKRQYIDGYALRWRSLIHRGDGKCAWFMPGSIKSPMKGKPKLLLFDHREDEIICTTDNGLILYADDYGLAMRVVPPNTSSGRKAIETVRDGSRTALSVGVTMHGDHWVDIDGLRVKMVREATLHEISLVSEGACEPAFCQLVDAEDSRTLVESSRSLKLLCDGAAKNFLDAGHDLIRRLRAYR